MTNWKGYGRKPQWPNPDAARKTARTDWRKQRKFSVNLVADLAYIQTEYLSNITLQKYSQSSPHVTHSLMELSPS
jgi:hypothetical protein